MNDEMNESEHVVSDGPDCISSSNDSSFLTKTDTSVSTPILLGNAVNKSAGAPNPNKYSKRKAHSKQNKKGSLHGPVHAARVRSTDRTTPKRAVLKSKLASIIERYGDQLVSVYLRNTTGFT